jgi:hypothetical protein
VLYKILLVTVRRRKAVSTMSNEKSKRICFGAMASYISLTLILLICVCIVNANPLSSTRESSFIVATAVLALVYSIIQLFTTFSTAKVASSIAPHFPLFEAIMLAFWSGSCALSMGAAIDLSDCSVFSQLQTQGIDVPCDLVKAVGTLSLILTISHFSWMTGKFYFLEHQLLNVGSGPNEKQRGSDPPNVNLKRALRN